MKLILHKYLSILIFCSILFISCNSETRESKVEGKQLELSGSIQTLLADSTPVSSSIDSLKKVFLNKNEQEQLLILGELAELWRPNTLLLANEELRQAKKLNSKLAEGDALCKKGIYYCRKSMFDSAAYFLNAAEEISVKDKLESIEAQTLSWQAEILRLSGDYGSSVQLQDKAITIANKILDKKRLAFCYISKGESDRFRGNFELAIQWYLKALYFANAASDLNKMAICYNSMGDVYRVQNNYPLALDYFNQGLAMAKRNRNKQQEAFCLSGMGDIYSTQQEFDKALSYYLNAYKIAIDLGIKLQECNSLSSIALNFYLSQKNDSAIIYLNKTIQLAEEIGNKDKSSFANVLLADIYASKKENAKALNHYQKAIEICEETGDKIQLASVLNHQAEYYLTNNQKKEALAAAEKSLKIAQVSKTPEEIKKAAKVLSSASEELGNLKEALVKLKLFYAMRDTTNSNENIKKIAAIEYKAKEDGLKAEQKAKEISFKAEQEKKEVELKRQKTIRYAFTIGFILVFLLAIVVFRSLQQNKKQNKIIVAQKKEVEHQKEIVEEKNKEITDSITYAKRLQEAILPPEKMVKQEFPQSFILYKPKDIIAGDFYWMEKIGDITFIAAADSTGHGVPGAMVSVVCSNALNRAVKEFKLMDPGRILDKTRELVLETFEKSEGDVKDGMDISLLSLNRTEKKISWAGANNPLWYIQNNELKEIKATKQPIGKTENPTPFQTHTVISSTETFFCLITDGFADQFGGPKGKKFKYKNLSEELTKQHSLEPETIKTNLNDIFENWRGTLDQVDDVTIIGIKI